MNFMKVTIVTDDGVGDKEKINMNTDMLFCFRPAFEEMRPGANTILEFSNGDEFTVAETVEDIFRKLPVGSTWK